jgi:hypothetical protein
MAAYLVNPWGSPSYNGMNPDGPEGYADIDFTYVYDVTLSALQALPNQSVATTNDADFIWRAVVITTLTGPFTVLFKDSQRFQLSNAQIAWSNIVGDASSPYPIFPEIVIPAGGEIGIDITDTSGAPNVIQIAFRGVKRFKLA